MTTAMTGDAALELFDVDAIDGRARAVAKSRDHAANQAMDRYAGGDASAFADLYDALAPRLYGFLIRQLRDKARWYLDAGVAIVWLLFPREREVLVVTRAEESRHHPGARLPPVDLAQGVARPVLAGEGKAVAEGVAGALREIGGHEDAPELDHVRSGG